LAQKEDIGRVLLIGTSLAARCTRAVLDGLSANVNDPVIMRLRDRSPLPYPGRARRFGMAMRDRSLRETSGSGPDPYDLVVVGKHPRLDDNERKAIDGARLVVLAGINSAPLQSIHARLIEDERYALVSHESSADDGHSAFRRLPA
jgi:hypothetical protein